MTDRRVSVIICAYTEERWSDLEDAITSLGTQDTKPAEVIIVIDHNPVLLERARALLTDVLVVENTQAPGLSGARNSGVAASTAPIVAFLDDDATAASDWITCLCAAYDDPSVLGVGGAIEPRWSTSRPRWFPPEFDWVVGCTYRGHNEAPGPVRNLIGANMSFRREVIAAVGGFRSGVGQIGASMLRCDDTEFCIRVHQTLPSGTLRYEPHAMVFHHVPAARTRWRYFRRRCYTEGMAKALIARLVGTHDGLSAERSYTLRALPAAVARGIADAIVRRDTSGLARAGAVVAGFMLTAFGYVASTIVGQSAER